MSENINFISASELPITEGTEVDLLCVENGELKRKAGASLGDSGYDAIITTTDFLDINAYTLVNGTYEKLKAKLLNNTPPNVNVMCIYEDGEGNVCHDSVSVMTMHVSDSEDSLLWLFLRYIEDTYCIAIINDDTITAH